MTESKFEQVSSIVDDQQVSENVLDDISQDQELSATWERYNLIGNVMRDEAPDTINLDLTAQISAAIAEEPAILAPQPKTSLKEKISAKVFSFAKPFGQMAIAASAAGLMILGVQQHNMADNNQVVPTQVIQTNPLGGFAEPVSLNYQENNQRAQKQAFIEQQRRFQALLRDHQQQVKLTTSLDEKKTLKSGEEVNPEVKH